MKENRASRARRVGGGRREILLQPGEKDPFLSMDVLDDALDDAFAAGDHPPDGLALIRLALEPLQGALELTTYLLSTPMGYNQRVTLRSHKEEGMVEKERRRSSVSGDRGLAEGPRAEIEAVRDEHRILLKELRR